MVPSAAGRMGVSKLRLEAETNKATKKMIPLTKEQLEDRLIQVNGELPTATVSQIASIIELNWRAMNFAAVTYVRAMRSMWSVDSKYGCDDGRSIILYFLSNASTWRGPIAKAVKAELNKRLKNK